jgi:pilus assembly protein FimV
MKSLARWGALPLLGLPLGSWALGLGEIEAVSFLNQPLNAEIPFTATPEEMATLSVSLAPVAAFTGAGLDYPAFLNSIEFEIGQNGAGQNVIEVNSNQVITEPFVTILVQVSHARGSVTREYSVLLDPPLFLPAQAAPPQIEAPVNRAQAPAVAGGQVVRPQPEVAPPAPQPQQAPPAPAQAAAAPPAQSLASGDYTVQNGDTLWGIANQARPAGVSVNQAMISIFETNPAAFEGNINRLRRGAILRIPPAADLNTVAAAEATAEVRRQIDAWQNNVESTPALVLLPPSENASAGNAAASTTASARVNELEAELSNLENDLNSTAAELAETERLLELRNQELADLQNQLNQVSAAEASAEAEVTPAGEVAPDVTDEPEQLFVDEPAVDEAAAAAAAEAAEEPAEEAVVAPPVVAPPVVAAPSGPSLVDQAWDFVKQPFVLIGAGVFILVIAALAFLRRRRDEPEDVTGQWEALEAELDEEADNEATARIRARAEASDIVVVEGHAGDSTARESRLGGTAEIEALDSGTAEIAALDSGLSDFDSLDSGTAEVESLLDPDDDFLGGTGAFPAPKSEPPGKRASSLSDNTLSSQTVINLDQADPIAEADFHMAYGLYDQAADLIAKALSADPDNRALKLKLLEVYFVWGNKEQFLEQAMDLRADIGSGGNPDWDKVVIMGKQICPDEAIFSEATAAASVVDLDLESSGTSAGLDFAFEAEEDEGVDLDFGIVDDDDLSLAASGRDKGRESADSADDDMLDIGARTQAGLEAALREDTDDAGEQTRSGDAIGDLDATMESPTVSTDSADFADALTVENPTIEAEGPDAPTVETPTIESRSPYESDAGDTAEHIRPAGSSDMTAEIEIDDLGLEFADIDDLPMDLPEGPDEQPASGDATVEHKISVDDDDDDLLSATGVTQVLDAEDADVDPSSTAIISDDDATMMAPGFDPSMTGTSTAVLEHSPSNYDPDPPGTDDDLDLNLDDFSSALEGADTVEQPRSYGFGGNLDLDIGADVPADDEPTGTEEVSPLDPQTMTEVGTKLDLARAYIDMGDPEGAKSILEEVLGEGDAGQRDEAKALIDALPG